MTSPPLSGVRVVTLEHAVAAPLCTRHLAEFGADVIKVERPGQGDFARQYDAMVHGQSTHFVWLNRGKRSIALNFKHEDGWRILVDLVADADVLVLNLSPRTSDRIADHPDLLAVNHRLIRCVISGYGTSGPYQDRKSYDLLVQGEAGVTRNTGTPEQPAKPGVSLSDLAAGTYAMGAIAAALAGREPDGAGERIDVSLFDATVEWMMPLVLAQANAGHTPPPAGTRHATICPYGPFVAEDGVTVNIAVQNKEQWERLCTDVLEDPALAADPRLQGNAQRLARRETVETHIAEAVALLHSDVLVERLDRSGVPWGRLNDVEDVIAHPQLAARDCWCTAILPDGQETSVLRGPMRRGNDPTPGVQRVPALGEHTTEVLRGLGYSTSRITALRNAGIVDGGEVANRERDRSGPEVSTS